MSFHFVILCPETARSPAPSTRRFLAILAYYGGMADTLRHDYTVRAAARVCSCTPETVQGWIATGKLRAYQLGGTGHYRIPASELDRVRSEWAVHPDTSGAV